MSVSALLLSLLSLPLALALEGTAEDRLETTFGSQTSFLWGAATAAYQVEGAWNRDGRQPSIWDVFAQTPGKIHNNDNGNTADNFYELYESDIQRVVDYGLNSFRYSISWSRIFPRGPDGVQRANPKGVQFYKNITTSLLDKGITPLVTMFHWDLPADLDWLNSTVIDAFVEYADFLFETFPEVKHWLTFNEPLTFCDLGYGVGVFAPGVKSEFKQYICAHNVLLAHAQAVAVYKEKYQASCHGHISITLNYDFCFPYDPDSPADREATQLHHDFGLGWFADPIYLTGDYPRSMRARLGSNLPTFTAAQQQLLKGSYSGFYGLNTYSGAYVVANKTDLKGFNSVTKGLNGKEIGPLAASSWLRVVPRAIRAQLEYVYNRYHPPAIIITENGVDMPGENDLPMPQALDDTFRVEFYRSYLDEVASAVRESGVPVTGYFAWSLLDNFEWADGYSCRFGLTYVDYATQKRYPKRSAQWFTRLMERMRVAGHDAEDRFIVEALKHKRDFMWGTATASYQIEGAWNEDGRQQSIWDLFAHTAGKTDHGDTGDIADDFYHLYQSDIQRVADYGFNAFRYSIAWPRIFPRDADGIHRPNPKGVEFYKNVFAVLRARNVAPIVTMFHWDLPSELDWLDKSVVEAFADYADFLYRTFPEVKHWITFNEPYSFCALGYGIGVHAPGIKSEFKQYICGHNVLLAHARAVAIFREKYMWTSGAEIGITLNLDFGFPLNASDPADHAAAQLYHDYNLGWFADPIYLTGDYPASMRQRLGEHLPTFTPGEMSSLKGSYEGFYGMNTYSAKYVSADAKSTTGFSTTYRGFDGRPIGPMAASDWLYVAPRGIRAQLEYVNDRYRPTSIMVTENGVDVPGEDNLPLDKALDDTFRVDFYRAYIGNVAAAVVESGVPVKGYFAWSLLDNYEWADGYSRRFGLTYVDYATQKRYSKQSAKWFTSLFQQMRGLPTSAEGGRGRDLSWLWLFLGMVGVMALVVTPVVMLIMRGSKSKKSLKQAGYEATTDSPASRAVDALPGSSGAGTPLIVHGSRIDSLTPSPRAVPVPATSTPVAQYQMVAPQSGVYAQPSSVMMSPPYSASPMQQLIYSQPQPYAPSYRPA